MGRIFDMDNPFFRFIGKLVDVVWLNLIWIVFSIPVVTIGASTTAMYSVTLKMVRDKEGYIWQGFWKAFKQNFKQATIIWVIITLAATVLGVDIYFFYNNTSKFSRILMALIIGISLVLFCMAIYIFPLLAQFENTTKQTFKNAMVIAVRHLPFTILLAVIYLVCGFLIYGFFPLTPLFGFGLLAFITSYIYTKVFIHYIPEEMRNDY